MQSCITREAGPDGRRVVIQNGLTIHWPSTAFWGAQNRYTGPTSLCIRPTLHILADRMERRPFFGVQGNGKGQCPAAQDGTGSVTAATARTWKVSKYDRQRGHDAMRACRGKTLHEIGDEFMRRRELVFYQSCLEVLTK